MDEEITALIAEITAAFHDVQRGEGVTLHEAQVLDDYGGAELRRQAREWDTDTHWWEVPDEDFLANGPYLCFLDDLGWRYYLPVCLIHALKIFHDQSHGETDSRDYSLEMLTYFDQEDLDRFDLMQQRRGRPPYRRRPGVPGDREKQRWAILRTAQSQAVCRYLRFVAAYDSSSFKVRDAEKGLRQFWGQFCDKRDSQD